jgi:hydroxymethylpyrimidine/phosphomethylpyrimidine kinase
MLASADTVDVVAEAFRRHKVTTSVVDPVRLTY